MSTLISSNDSVNSYLFTNLYGEEYEDVLGERRGESDLRWAAQEWQSTGGFRRGKRVTHAEAVQHVLRSVRVQQAINKVSEAEGKPAKIIKKDVTSILETMGHSQDISAIRKFAFVLPKIMKTICDRLIVHKPGIERLRRLVQQQPVVLLPTHRSYADFLLVSYLSFHYRLPQPIIAAGMDFIHMAYIGSLFREAGAFYIKRSFMEEDLYWAVFQEYVHVLVCQESAPLEFFLEGTRSRSGKSLRPKLGLLGCVCQCCWRKHTADVYLIPLNISYSRTLEEELYAYEMLGVPKPKESTSGLYKAKNILGEQYGNIFVHVGIPISAHRADLIRRDEITGLHDIAPLSVGEISAVERVGLSLVRAQQGLAVISSFSLIAHYLLQALATSDNPLISYENLLSHVDALLKCTRDAQPGLAGVLHWEGEGLPSSLDDILRSSLRLHRNVIDFEEDGVNLRFTYLNSKAQPKENHDADSFVKSSVLGVMLQHYANQSIHVFIRPALVWLALSSKCNQIDCQGQGIIQVDLNDVKKIFSKLCALFGNDFIFSKDSEDEDFKEGLERICITNVLERIGNTLLVHLSFDAQPPLLTIISCLKPFSFTYNRALRAASLQEWGSEAALATHIQRSIELDLRKLTEDTYYSSLSLDSIRNAVRSITKCGGLRNIRANGSGSPSKLVPCEAVLLELTQVLNGLANNSSQMLAKL